MSEPKKDKQFIHKPYYVGGPKAMLAFVRENLRYPSSAAEQGIRGTVQLRYTINYLGKVVDVKVIKHLGYGCDEEAERVVRLLQFEVKRPHHLRVEFQKSINIHFKPPAPAKAKTIQYAYHYQDKKDQESTNQVPSGYSYTITLNSK